MVLLVPKQPIPLTLVIDEIDVFVILACEPLDIKVKVSAFRLLSLLLTLVQASVVACKVPGHHKAFQIFILNLKVVS